MSARKENRIYASKTARQSSFSGRFSRLRGTHLAEGLSWEIAMSRSHATQLVCFCKLLVISLACCLNGFAAPPQNIAAAQEHAERGRQLLGRGMLSDAERELRQAVALASRDAEYLGLLGVALGMARKLEESDVYLERALQVDSSDSATRRNLAWNQFELGQLEAAKTNLERVLKEKPLDPTATLVMGMVQEELKHYDAAVRLLESVPQQVGQRPESIAALARAYYYTGQREKSREILKELPKQQSAEPESISVAAQVAAEVRDFEIAEALLQTLRAKYPDKEKFGYALARVEYRAGKIAASLGTLRRTIADKYESGEVYNLLGWCLFKNGDLKGAIAALDKAIAFDPADESNYLDVGTMLLQNHRFDGAMAAAEKALSVAPDSYRAHRLKAQIEFQAGRVNDAETHYARAVELNPADAYAITGLATAQLDRGNAAAAEETLKKAIARMPHEAVLYQAYGSMLLWGKGTTDSDVEAHAVQLLRKAEALDPSLAEARYQLGKLALRDNNPREALYQLEIAVKLDPESSKNHYGLAQAYRKLGRAADAGREVQLFQALKEKQDSTLPRPPATTQ
jgi:Flp pilus assembly protein TadD